MKKALFIFIISFIFLTKIKSQDKIKSYLFDADLKTPIEYAHIINLKDQKNASLTNYEGEFIIRDYSSKDDTIVISHLGYPTTKISIEYLSRTDTIFLQNSAVELNEITLYDSQSILEKVHESIPTNYPSSNKKENFFFRYFSKQNDMKFQIVESLISIKNQNYFDFNNEEDIEIEINANSTIRNNKLEGIVFEPSSYHELFQVVDLKLFVKDLIDSNKYDNNTQSIGSGNVKLSFESTSEKVIQTGSFKGYLIINLSDNSILKMYYERKYLSGKDITSLKKNYKIENIFKSGLLTWKVNEADKKYKLNLMIIEGDMRLSNEILAVNNLYQSSYLIKSTNNNLNDSKSIKARSRKSVVEYKLLNESKIEGDKLILKTKEQRMAN